MYLKETLSSNSDLNNGMKEAFSFSLLTSSSCLLKAIMRCRLMTANCVWSRKYASFVSGLLTMPRIYWTANKLPNVISPCKT